MLPLERTLITAGSTSRANVSASRVLLRVEMKTDIDGRTLATVTGGIHIVAGIKNAKTGAWESKQEFHIPDPKPAPPPTPTHITHGIWDVKGNKWLWKQEIDYMKP